MSTEASKPDTSSKKPIKIRFNPKAKNIIKVSPSTATFASDQPVNIKLVIKNVKKVKKSKDLLVRIDFGPRHPFNNQLDLISRKVKIKPKKKALRIGSIAASAKKGTNYAYLVTIWHKKQVYHLDPRIKINN